MFQTRQSQRLPACKLVHLFIFRSERCFCRRAADQPGGRGPGPRLKPYRPWTNDQDARPGVTERGVLPNTSHAHAQQCEV